MVVVDDVQDEKEQTEMVGEFVMRRVNGNNIVREVMRTNEIILLSLNNLIFLKFLVIVIDQ